MYRKVLLLPIVALLFVGCASNPNVQLKSDLDGLLLFDEACRKMEAAESQEVAK